MSRGITLTRRAALSGRAHPVPGTVLFLDDFASAVGAAPDTTKWVPAVARGGGNGEYDYRTNSTSNARHDGLGNLEIVLRNETAPDAGLPFTSARLETRGLARFLWPVRMEAKIRLPNAAGIWPAFWTDADRGGWPTTGEIDMFEGIVNSDGSTTNSSNVYFHTHQGATASPGTDQPLAGTTYDSGAALGVKTFTNLIPNPSVEVNATSYSAFGASSTGARVAGAAKLGGFGWRVTTGAAGTAQASAPAVTLTAAGLAVGDAISAGWYIKTALAGAKMIVQFYGTSNTVFLSQVNGTVVTDGLSVVQAATIPASCDTIRFLSSATATAASQTIDHDCLILVKDSYLPGDTGSGLHDFADGSTTGWAWSGTANASTSSGPGSGAYHTYAGEWFSDHVDFYFDGVKRATISRSNAAAAGAQWPIDSSPQCLILTFSYGGALPGASPPNPPAWTDLRMKVDYVKVTAL